MYLIKILVILLVGCNLINASVFKVYVVSSCYTLICDTSNASIFIINVSWLWQGKLWRCHGITFIMGLDMLLHVQHTANEGICHSECQVSVCYWTTGWIWDSASFDNKISGQDEAMWQHLTWYSKDRVSMVIKRWIYCMWGYCVEIAGRKESQCFWEWQAINKCLINLIMCAGDIVLDHYPAFWHMFPIDSLLWSSISYKQCLWEWLLINRWLIKT